jgi:uridine kinase
MSGARASVLRRLAAHLRTADFRHPLRVGIDGICGSGKITFCSELVEAVGATGRSVVHLDLERPRIVRGVEP